jgi:hypothetical protein
MRDDGKELVKARPWQRPGRSALRQIPYTRRSALMPRTIATVSVDENVRVDGNQLPRPS